MDLERKVASLKEINNLPQKAFRLGLVTLFVYGGYFAISEGAGSASANGPASPTKSAGSSNPERNPLATAVRTVIAEALGTPTKTPTRGVPASSAPEKTPTAGRTPTAEALGTPTKTAAVGTISNKSEVVIPPITINNDINITVPSQPSYGPDTVVTNREDFDKHVKEGIDAALAAREREAKKTATPSPTPSPRPEQTIVPGGAAAQNTGWSFDVWSALIGVGAGASLLELARYFRRRIHLPHHHPHEHPAAPAGGGHHGHPAAPGAPLEDDLAEE